MGTGTEDLPDRRSHSTARTPPLRSNPGANSRSRLATARPRVGNSSSVDGEIASQHGITNIGRRSSETAVALPAADLRTRWGCPSSEDPPCRVPMLTHLSMSALRGARSQFTPSTAAPDPKPVIYPTLFLAGPIPCTVAIGSGSLRGRMCAPAGCATGPSVVSPAVLAEVPVGFNCVGSLARGTLVTARQGIGCRGRPGQFSRGGRRGHRARGR